MDILDEILGLPRLTIERTEVQATEIHLYGKLRTESAICPPCHQECRELHQNAGRVIRDLPLSGRPCSLHVRIRRFWCPRCGLPIVEPLEFVEPYRNDTTRYEGHIYELVRQNNITYVEALDGVSDEVVEGIFLREATRRIPAEPFQGLQRLGIDEIAERKGRNAYDVILYNLETGKPVDVLAGRTKVHLAAHLTGLPEEMRRRIQAGCIDRWRP
jgi:transposase